MPQPKKIKINGVEGRGYLEVVSPPPPRTRKKTMGVAVFDTRERVDAMNKVWKEGEAEYEGVVYERGKATVVACPILVRKIRSEGSSARVFFKAQGSPYSD